MKLNKRTKLAVSSIKFLSKHRLFNKRLAGLLQDFLVVRACGLFDSKWYLETYPEAAEQCSNPIWHYCSAGWLGGNNPSPAFDGAAYLKRNCDVKKSGMNPLVHYVLYGDAEGRTIEAFFEDDVAFIRRSDYFDEQWYRATYGISAEDDAAEHYLYKGWNLGYNPSSKFDGNAYLDFYDDVAEAHMCPLLHYEKHGRGGKRFAPVVGEAPRDVLIVTSADITDGVYVWRLVFIKEWLETNGFSVHVESVREPTDAYLSSLMAARFVIFNRAIFLKSFFGGISLATMRCLLSWDKKFCLDIDDLMMLQYGDTLGKYKSCGIKYDTLKATLCSHSNSYSFAKTMTVSTPFLAECLAHHFGLRTVLLPNTIPVSRCVGKPASWTPCAKLRLLYASGTATHLYDLSTIHLRLLNFLLRHEDATLTILGFSAGMAEFSFLGDRVGIVDCVEYDRMLEIFGEHDLVLVPLDNNETNDAKSNIKYIEAGAVGTPVIAQDCMEFRSAIRDGENGFLYSSPEEFEDKMEAILKDRDRLAAVGQTALEDVRKNHSTAMPLPTAFKEMICS